MSKMFPDGDPLAAQIESQYLEVWAQLSPATRSRIRAGVDDLMATEVDEIARLPHRERTLTEWLNKPVGARCNLFHGFAEWARREAPTGRLRVTR